MSVESDNNLGVTLAEVFDFVSEIEMYGTFPRGALGIDPHSQE